MRRRLLVLNISATPSCRMLGLRVLPRSQGRVNFNWIDGTSKDVDNCPAPNVWSCGEPHPETIPDYDPVSNTASLPLWGTMLTTKRFTFTAGQNSGEIRSRHTVKLLSHTAEKDCNQLR